MKEWWLLMEGDEDGGECEKVHMLKGEGKRKKADNKIKRRKNIYIYIKVRKQNKGDENDGCGM
jgi:hypothetical protein